jgi:hypothetical protein
MTGHGRDVKFALAGEGHATGDTRRWIVSAKFRLGLDASFPVTPRGADAEAPAPK